MKPVAKSSISACTWELCPTPFKADDSEGGTAVSYAKNVPTLRKSSFQSRASSRSDSEVHRAY